MTSNLECSVELAVTIIGSKWKLLILRDLISCSKLKYEELLERLEDITPRVLSQNLKELEKFGVITRKDFNEKSVTKKSEYKLTKIGLSFIPVMDQIAVWGIEYRKYAESMNIKYKNIVL